jgi:hypothetical protein
VPAPDYPPPIPFTRRPAGKSENAISPSWLSHGRLAAVKPLHDLGGAEDFVESRDDEVGYTLDDLIESAESLRANYARFETYARDIALIS